jgi:hypothetical protein
MAFWDTKTKEPLRQNRWYLRFGNNVDKDLDQFTFALKECKKPEYEIGVTEHRLLTHTLRYPTLLKWKPIDIKFVSARGDSGSLTSYLEKINSDSGYRTPSANHQQIVKDKSIESIGSSINIIQVNENGEDIEIWEINNPFISNVSYGTLSYENEGFVEISCTIQYDWANKTLDLLNK